MSESEKVNIDDLFIGAWLLYCGQYAVVVSIDNSVAHSPSAKVFVEGSVVAIMRPLRNLDPIPITADILGAFGFTYLEPAPGYASGTWTRNPLVFGGTKYPTLVRYKAKITIETVHELQWVYRGAAGKHLKRIDL